MVLQLTMVNLSAYWADIFATKAVAESMYDSRPSMIVVYGISSMESFIGQIVLHSIVQIAILRFL